MHRVLHLRDVAADYQTCRTIDMLATGLRPEFDSTVQTIGRGGAHRDLLQATLQLRRTAAPGKTTAPALTFAWGLRSLSIAVMSDLQPVVFCPDQFLGPRRLRWLRSLLGMRRASQCVMVCPTATQQRVAIENGINPDRCRVIFPGVDFSRLSRDRSIRLKLGLSPSDHVLLLCGESTPQAGHEQSLWAAGILHVLDPAYKVLAWGRGSSTIKLITLSKRLRQRGALHVAESILKQPVDFEVIAPAADACLIAATAVVPTLPVLTTMAAGTPIIAASTYSIGEMLEDRHSAVLVREASPRLLAQRVLELRADQGLRRRLIETARSEAYEHFSKSKMVGAFRDLCTEIISAKSAKTML